MVRSLASVSMLVLAMTSAPSAPVPKERAMGAGAYPTTVGTKWVYDQDGLEWVEEIIRAEEQNGETRLTVRVTAPQAVDDTFSVTKAGVFWRTVGEFKIDHYRLRFPLRVGDSWEVRTPVQTGLEAESGRMTVGKEEVIKVPAGTFRAVPVKFEVTSVNGQVLTHQKVYTFWYAPGVGLVKQTLPFGQRVLTSYTPPKK